jgi:hypothetical protein
MYAHPEILSEYFSNISKVKELSELAQYASLRMEWLCSYLEARIERGEPVEVDLREIALNLRFDKQIKMGKLASLISIVTGAEAKNIIQQMHICFSEADHVFGKQFVQVVHD